jgi:hypothetical protein
MMLEICGIFNSLWMLFTPIPSFPNFPPLVPGSCVYHSILSFMKGVRTLSVLLFYSWTEGIPVKQTLHVRETIRLLSGIIKPRHQIIHRRRTSPASKSNNPSPTGSARKYQPSKPMPKSNLSSNQSSGDPSHSKYIPKRLIEFNIRNVHKVRTYDIDIQKPFVFHVTS